MKWRIVSVGLALVLTGCAGLRDGLARPRAAMADQDIRAKAYSHYLAAVVYEQQGRFEKAVGELRQASDLDPAALSIHTKLAHVYLYLRDYDNALVAYKRASECRPQDVSLWMLIGEINRRLERYDEASEAFQQALNLDPNTPTAYEALLQIEETTNDLVAVIETYEELLKLHPNAPQLRLQLAINYARIGDSESTIRELKQALALDPSMEQPLLLLGIAYMELNDPQQAVSYFEDYLETNPNDPAARENLAGVLAQTGEWDAALDILEDLSADAQAATTTQLAYMYLLLRAGRYDQANDLIPPNGSPILGTFFRGVARKYAGEAYLRILSTLDDAEGDVEDEASDNLRFLMFLFGQDDTGVYLLNVFNDLDDEGVQSRFIDILHARVLMFLDHFSEAEAVLLRGLDRFGSDQWIHYYLALIYEDADDFERTEKHLKACLEFVPEDPDLLNFLGYLYAEHGVKLDEAKGLIKRALEMDPANPFYLDSMGWVYYREGDAETAIDYIRQAIMGMETDDAVLRDHLGDAYWLKGDKAKAIAEWERALRLDPEIPGVQEKLTEHGAGKE